MSHVVRQDIDALNAQIIVTLTANDYGKKIKDQIQKYSKNAQIKGFRPGKTPPALIKKMYGKSFMMDIVNKEINDHLNKFMEESKDSFLGQPVLSASQDALNFDLDNLKDIVTKFDIGVEPAFELRGLNKDTILNYFDVQISENLVDEEVAKIRKESLTQLDLARIESENDYMTLVVNYEYNGEAKENSFGILAQDLTEDARKVFDTKLVGDKFTFNLYNLEQESTDDNVKTYFLGLTKEDDVAALGTDFEIEIKSIMNRKEANLDQAFFDKYFGEGRVNSEEQMRDVIRRAIATQRYKGAVDTLVFNDLRQTLFDQNSIELPEKFLYRWLLSIDEKNTPELLEKEFATFIFNLKWTIIRRKIIEEAQIQVTEEDLRNYYKMRIREYLGGVENEQIEEMMADRVMEDEKQTTNLIEDFLTDAAYSYARLKVTLAPKPISAEEFESLIGASTKESQSAELHEEVNV